MLVPLMLHFDRVFIGSSRHKSVLTDSPSLVPAFCLILQRMFARAVAVPSLLVRSILQLLRHTRLQRLPGQLQFNFNAPLNRYE